MGKKLTKAIVNERIKSRGIRLISEYLGVQTKSLFQCSKNHQWNTRPQDVIQGKGCPTCAEYGFNPNKSAILYYLKIETLIYTLYKIGITNLTVKKRFKSADYKKITILSEQYFENGQDAWDIESCIHKLNKQYQYKGEPVLVSNGNTELYTHPLSWWSKAL